MEDAIGDLFGLVGIGANSLKLMNRSEQSRAKSGLTRVGILGPDLWVGDWASVPKRVDEIEKLHARLNACDNGASLFWGFHMGKLTPAAHPSGASNGSILSLNVDNTHMALDGLNAGQVLTMGDFISFPYAEGAFQAFHQIVSPTTITANGSGATAEFEVRPHIRPGATTGTTVLINYPMAQFFIDPGSISMNTVDALFSTVSFRGIQYCG